MYVGAVVIALKAASREASVLSTDPAPHNMSTAIGVPEWPEGTALQSEAMYQLCLFNRESRHSPYHHPMWSLMSSYASPPAIPALIPLGVRLEEEVEEEAVVVAAAADDVVVDAASAVEELDWASCVDEEYYQKGTW